MIVISDTSPIRYLVEIALEDVLSKLFTDIWIPRAIELELTHTSAPLLVRQWIAAPPTWIKVADDEQSPEDHKYQRNLGEQSVIRLARRSNAELLLMDDASARRTAEQSGFIVVGTVGVLARAARRNLIDIDAAFVSLSKTNFRLTKALLNRARADSRYPIV
jgi:predicted nucleic acid-binding protein